MSRLLVVVSAPRRVGGRFIGIVVEKRIAISADPRASVAETALTRL